MNQVGKRFRCGMCGGEILVTKSGEGPLRCCDAAMEIIEPKKTASAD